MPFQTNMRGSGSIFISLFAFLYLFHGWVIWHYSVNIPFGDAWELIHGALTGPGWIFSRLNEHMIVFTKLQSLVFLKLFHWNIRAELLWNYALFGLLILILDLIRKLCAPDLKRGYFFLILSFLCTPLIFENHMWNIQSCFHYCLIFLLLGGARFIRAKNSRQSLIGVLLLLGSMFSLASGLFAVLALVLLVNFLRRKDITSLVLTGLGIGMWFGGFQSMPGQPMTFPHKLWFWKFFLNLVSGGFGFEIESSFVGLGCLVFVLFPMGAFWYRRRSLRNIPSQILLPQLLALSVLAMLAAIALGRAHYMAGTKTSRYVELSIVLVPLSFLSWWVYLEKPNSRAKFFWAFCAFLVISFADSWNFVRPYREQQVKLLEGRDCLRAQWDEQQIHCPALSPVDLRPKIDIARTLKFKIGI